jgi:hypothetical protein
MRRLLILGLIVTGVVGLGAYRGWFLFSSGRHDKKPNIMMSVDEDKIREDKDKAVKEVQNLGQQAKDKVSVTTRKAQD